MPYVERKLPEPGETVGGKYRVVRRIGEGGMGVVFEAVHKRINQRVALKMLLPDVLIIPDVVSRFEREARAAGQLRSENAARVVDVDISEGGIPYMVMEYLDGQDLSKVLEARTQLPIAESVDYVLQTCNAMAEAHQLGIIHRDLKPSNLFLCGGDRPVVKVLDFGISKLENDKDTRLTSTQVTVGTPLYMSPEQIRSARHVDARTDIWSLSIILYELLAGKTPFEGSTAAAAAAICIDEPPPLSSFRRDVPASLEAVILKGLSKSPGKRFEDMPSLAAAILPFGSGAVRGPRSESSNPTLMPPVISAHPTPDSRPTLGAAEWELASAPTLAGASEPRTAATLPGWITRSTRVKATSRGALIATVASVGTAAIALGIYLAARVPHDSPHDSPASAAGTIAPLVSTMAPPSSTLGSAVPVLSAIPTQSSSAPFAPTLSVKKPTPRPPPSPTPSQITVPRPSATRL